jgi:hypothetical protein
MKERTAVTVIEFLKWVDGLESPIMFRGQASHWPLLPSIARLPRLRATLKGYENWEVFQSDIIERFAKYARPLLQAQPLDIEEWLVHAQHNGAPTRLLDWTTNPLKALFWAVEDFSSDRANGVVWAFSPKHWRDDPLVPTGLDERRLTPYFPKHLNARVIAQEGCFVAFPLPPNRKPLTPMSDSGAYPADVDSLSKVTIPANSKASLRIELRMLGVAHRFVFPDLVGIVASIRGELRA